MSDDIVILSAAKDRTAFTFAGRISNVTRGDPSRSLP